MIRDTELKCQKHEEVRDTDVEGVQNIFVNCKTGKIFDITTGQENDYSKEFNQTRKCCECHENGVKFVECFY